MDERSLKDRISVHRRVDTGGKDAYGRDRVEYDPPLDEPSYDVPAFVTWATSQDRFSQGDEGVVDGWMAVVIGGTYRPLDRIVWEGRAMEIEQVGVGRRPGQTHHFELALGEV